VSVKPDYFSCITLKAVWFDDWEVIPTVHFMQHLRFWQWCCWGIPVVGDVPLCHWVSSSEQLEGLWCAWSLMAARWSWRCYSSSKCWQLCAQNTALHSRRLELLQYSPTNPIKSLHWLSGSSLQSNRGKKEYLTWRLFVSVHQWPCVSALAIGLFFLIQCWRIVQNLLGRCGLIHICQ
jgi:hypothetical protein